MKKHLNKSASILVATAFILCQNLPLLALAQEDMSTNAVSEDEQTPQVEKTEHINLVIGDVQSIETSNLTRVAVTSPEIVDISDAKSDKVFVVGKKAGQTEVFIWDDNGKRSISVGVASENLDVLTSRIEEVISKAQIKGIVVEKNLYEGKVILSGAATKEDKDILDRIMDPYSEKIINLVKRAVNDDLIQIDCQVTELSQTLVKQLGINWSNATGSSSSTSSSNNTNTVNLQPTYQETLPTSNGKPEDWFKIGNFNRTTALQATVDALITEGKGRILSKPRLVVLSGKEASFLVGGQVPIRTTTFNSTNSSSGGAGTSQENVTYKQYGVNMTITPTIREGKVDIVLNVQINDIDKSTSDSQGDVGFISREASTHLFLDDKQTIILAGFIKHSDGRTVNRVPFLSKIPVVGMFFRNVTNGNPDSDTEMVISLTPTILKSKKIATEQTVLPSKRTKSFVKEVDTNYEKETIDGQQLIEPKAEEPKAQEKPAAVITATPPVEPKQNFGPHNVSVEPKATDTKKAEVSAPVADVKPIEEKPVQIINQPQDPLTSYVRSVQMRISQKITYPFEALQNNQEGTVKLRLRILKDGSLADCDLLESSGKDIFDRDALNTAKIVAPFQAFPENLHQEDLILTIPIVYNQRTEVTNNTQAVMASY